MQKPEGWERSFLEMMERAEKQPFEVVAEDGEVTLWHPKTIAELVAEGVTECEITESE